MGSSPLAKLKSRRIPPEAICSEVSTNDDGALLAAMSVNSPHLGEEPAALRIGLIAALHAQTLWVIGCAFLVTIVFDARAQSRLDAGKWVPTIATSNVLGGCVQTWECHPSATSMRSTESSVIATPRQNTTGACAITSNPKECGQCVAPEPATTCHICVEPPECSNSSLGWRTRQELHCCR